MQSEGRTAARGTRAGGHTSTAWARARSALVEDRADAVHQERAREDDGKHEQLRVLLQHVRKARADVRPLAVQQRGPCEPCHPGRLHVLKMPREGRVHLGAARRAAATEALEDRQRLHSAELRRRVVWAEHHERRGGLLRQWQGLVIVLPVPHLGLYHAPLLCVRLHPLPLTLQPCIKIGRATMTRQVRSASSAFN